MKQILLTAVLTIAGISFNQTHAQSLSSVKDDVTVAKALTIDNENAQWAFYADEENKNILLILKNYIFTLIKLRY